MEELSLLKEHLLAGRYNDALAVVEEMEEMSKQDKLNAIDSFLVRLLVHLIKNHVENRLTTSWAVSISDSVREIRKRNLRDNRSSWLIVAGAWRAPLEEAFPDALEFASREAFGGVYRRAQLAPLVDREAVLQRAENLLELMFAHSRESLPDALDEMLGTLPGGEGWENRGN
ncbi:MAG: DUF29 domain-containing protein [Blastocatellia bacterium]|nr:DUF29 domain-containing protein [Blastocatellia bacterium]